MDSNIWFFLPPTGGSNVEERLSTYAVWTDKTDDKL
jgi:hypothetical protein